MITIDRDSQKVIQKIENIYKLTNTAMSRASQDAAYRLHRATSQEILRAPKSGRVYTIYVNGHKRRHVASAAGETHANMTGALRRSLSYKATANEIEFGYGVGTTQAPKYSRSVEFGTKSMKARPSLQNGIEDQERDIEQCFEREIGKAL
jgi:HK97 gp10 family phage protein